MSTLFPKFTKTQQRENCKFANSSGVSTGNHTLRWIGPSASFSHPYWCKQKSTVDPVVVVMYNYVDLISKITCKFANFNNLLRFDDSSLRNAFEYLQINYISRNWSQCPTFLPLIVWVCSSLFTAFTQFMGLSLSLFMLCATQTPFSLKVLARKQILTLSSQSRLI